MNPTSAITDTDLHKALSRILDDRSTCRQFLPDPVPRETVERLLQMAQRTPSWCNTQPWQLHITEGDATERLRTGLLAHVQSHSDSPDFPFPAQYAGVYRERRRECGLQLYGSLGIAKGDQERTLRQLLRNFELFDAPHVAIITTEADLGVYGAVDCGLYINTFLLAAHSLGLAAAPQAALAAYSSFLRDHFGIPDNRRIVAGISFGHPDLNHPVNAFRTHREEPESAVTWHTS
ncbi:nitroreductase [Streptomyces sp. NPDC051956]|uniref:nitroreductase n=1 Tax=Streptomyces sp. NPDC051956 TaxID=3365677 RepID=UPI0037D35420